MYRPSMNVARDFSDSRMETQDKAGDDGAQADDGKSYEIPDNQDEADTAASTNAGGVDPAATGSQEVTAGVGSLDISA